MDVSGSMGDEQKYLTRNTAFWTDAWIDRTEGEKLLAEAEKLEQAGKLAEARDLLQQVVDKEPKLVVGHLALGVVLRRLGDFRGSVEACTKGIEIDPQEAELYLRRGISWFHQGLYGIALEDFEEAAGIAYDDPRPELWRGLALMELERPLEAINAYASAIRRDRTCMLAYLNRGLAYLDTDEPGKAEFDFNQAIRQRPKDARVWFNRGVAQARQGRFAEAVYSYETALGIEPGNADARRNLEAARGMVGRAGRRPGR
ncbi:MAG: tetratricopeptide repeat protein [Planctomycetia bacterium]|nr:tetratricopeptide repeat protein [Planctomycetia bacterium]